MKTRSICIYCQKWESGGIESFLYNTLIRMDLKGLEIEIVADQLADSIFTAPLQARGIRFTELSGSQRKLWKNGRMFRKLLCLRQYDVLHFNAFQGLSLRLLKLANAVPVRIAHSHNTDLRKSLTRPVKLLLHRLGSRLYTRYATERWACSKAAADFLFGRDTGFRLIPNGIDTERFRFDPLLRETARMELGLHNDILLGNVGRLCSQKNQSFLLDVFAVLQKTCANSVLLLVGEGGDMERLRQKADRLGIADRVIFCGTTSSVERLYQAMDVFVFPSLFEGLGIVAVEAQAAGLPVLCSDEVPMEACLTEQVRRLSLSDGTAVWAETLCRLAAEGRSTKGAETVRNKGFDVLTVAGEIEKVYRGN